MKIRSYTSVLTLSALLMAGSVMAREHDGDKSKANNQPKAAGCSPATTFTTMAFNNVRTGIETGGTMWYDRGNGKPYYIVPKDGGVSALFDGALWIGGIDPGGNLKLAAVRYRQVGNDFWPGPLSTDGAATVDAATCSKWDRHFPISKAMVAKHRYYFTLLAEGKDPSKDPLFANGYTIPPEIMNWPAHGDLSKNQAQNLAPFHDFVNPVTGEVMGTPGLYEPDKGDYPWYDFDNESNCRTRKVTDKVPLFGDYTLYWIINDKGNIHTESGGEPIGMEIQAQGFAFSTNDEVNNMTFYNYTLINRGTLTLTNTYMGQYVDPDLGNPNDDYVGCDVGRGLGYCYNGDNNDENGASPGYGIQPPAIGVDFFEGPYQDPDGIDNAVGIGAGQALNGLGYGDGVIDNERYGMRRFLYYNNTTGPNATQDPAIATDYYNYLRGIWKDGTKMTYGGSGYAPNNPSAIPADFMFPGTSDPLHWGTRGIDPGNENWTEETANNPPGDRRFIQSAGPFTLDPGEFNNITVGVVYARANSGGPFASVQLLRVADEKAQSLFENCFRLVDGPDAPTLTAQELNKSVILYLSNNNPLSNNFQEKYKELDPTIPKTDTSGNPYDRYYRFEGYQVYQMVDGSASITDIQDPSKARLVFQCDLKNTDDSTGNPIAQLVNYVNDQTIGLPVPTLEVDGANQGIKHSFKITTDAFATGDNQMINFKKYYFLAIAYGYNNYQAYDPVSRSGQPYPYIASRQAAGGSSVTSITVIPHNPNPESNGTIANSSYGDELAVTRIEGRGNGGNAVELSQKSIDKIVSSPTHRLDTLQYIAGKGPIDVKIIDPLNVHRAHFTLKFRPALDSTGNPINDMSQCSWYLVNNDNSGDASSQDTIFSEVAINVGNEQIIPEYGISVTIEQYKYQNLGAGTSNLSYYFTDALNSSMTFDGGDAWLSGINDKDGNTLFNWIRSGKAVDNSGGSGYGGPPCYWSTTGPHSYNNLNPQFFNDRNVNYTDAQGRSSTLFYDPDQQYEGLINGTWTAAPLAAGYDCGPAPLTGDIYGSLALGGSVNLGVNKTDMTGVQSVEIVFTPDKSKWTRCPVLEMQTDTNLAEGHASKTFLRRHLSVDKNGLTQEDPGVNMDEATFNGTQVDANGKSYGMGWFPGYAVNLETGERLNMAFSEDSYLANDNGRDMLWNPTSRLTTALGENYTFGGQQYVYLFRNQTHITHNNADMPLYDGGQFMYNNFNIARPSTYRKKVIASMMYVGMPTIADGFQFKSPQDGLVPGVAKVIIDVAKPYERFATVDDELGANADPDTPVNTHLDLSSNDWYPMYTFSTDGMQTLVSQNSVAKSQLGEIGVVPNPYYAFSAYETSKLDNRVKFINLPPQCTIKIFNINGDLIRTLKKDNSDTYFDWDLKNEYRIPISGGVYICYVSAPGIGDQVVKFFAAMRPQDLNNF